MTNGFGPEKRKHVRVKIDGDLTIYHVQPSVSGNIYEVHAKPLVARISDVSENGIKMEVGDAHLPTEILKVKFNVHKHEPVDAYAKMVWKNGASCGLQFIILEKQSHRRIKEYVSLNL